jgi:carbon storage regulator
MLVLSRKQGERIMLTGGITITVTAIRDGKVRLGIEAPSHIDVYREELVGQGGEVPTLHQQTGIVSREWEAASAVTPHAAS